MRIKTLLYQNILFQYKYGFYFLYLIFSILYVSLLLIFPADWRLKASILMIFSDPAAMGLYFMGAIVLFEKNERVLDSYAVSPVKPHEYILSKLISIAIISTLFGFIIGLFGNVLINPFNFLISIFLASCLFSATGLIIASNISTLNQFILKTIPAELFINVPAIAYLFGWKPTWLIFHPGVCIIRLCLNEPYPFLSIIVLSSWTIFIALIARQSAAKMFTSIGGITL